MEWSGKFYNHILSYNFYHGLFQYYQISDFAAIFLELSVGLTILEGNLALWIIDWM